jgi:hypothetical protein
VIDRHPEMVVVNTMPTRGVAAIKSRLVWSCTLGGMLDQLRPVHLPANRRSDKEGAGAAVEPSMFRTLRFQRAPVAFSTCRLNQES